MSKLKTDLGIRALLAIIIVSGAVVGSLYLIFIGQWQLGMGFLSNAALTVSGIYFVSRSGVQPGAAPSNGEPVPPAPKTPATPPS